MPGSVSGSNGANPYLTTGWQQASPYLQQLGLDPKYSTQIGNILNGNTDAMITNTTDGIVDGLVSNPVANAAIKGAIDIVKIVLMGQYNKGQDIKDAGQNLTDINTLGNTSNQMADAGKTQSEQILGALQSDLDGAKTTVDDATNTITVTMEDGTSQVIEISEQNIATAEQIQKNQDLIDQNNSEIQTKQQRLTELSTQIAAKKAELGMSAEAPAVTGGGDAPSGAGEAPAGDSPQGAGFVPMSSDGIQNSELKALIQEYNELGIDISGLQQMNTTLTAQNATFRENIMNNVEMAETGLAERIEVTQEQAANIDSATMEIVSMCNNAQSAIGEVQNLLQGQFPKLDQVTLVKLATAMTKSAICGTNSGLLASAAAAMGVGSIVSFGATAQKAAELTAASVDQAAGSAKHIATNVAGKLIQQQMMSYMNQTLSNISQMTGVDLTQMQSLMTQYVQEQSTVSNTALDTFRQIQEENPLQAPENQTSVA